MTAAKSRSTKRPPAKKAAPRRRLSKAQIAKIDADIDAARGKPGYAMVRPLLELAKLGPYPGFKKLRIRNGE